MSTRSERIKALIEQSGMSYQDLEKLTGVKKSSLQRYASGVTTKIQLDVIEKLSVAFGVSQAYLMGWEEKEISPSEPSLTEGEKLLLKLFREIPVDRQPEALELLQEVSGSIPLISTKKKTVKPVISRLCGFSVFSFIFLYIGKFSSMTPSVTPSNNRNKEKRPSVEGLFFVTVPQSR